MVISSLKIIGLAVTATWLLKTGAFGVCSNTHEHSEIHAYIIWAAQICGVLYGLTLIFLAFSLEEIKRLNTEIKLIEQKLDKHGIEH